MIRETPSQRPTGWRAHRQEVRFLLSFTALLAGGFALVALAPVNDRAIEPYTGLVARAAGAVLAALDPGTEMHGTVIRSPRFAVNVRNGCNGVEAMLVFGAAVLAFPATWRRRLTGLGLGLVAIQLVNLLRVVALFLTGAYFPELFDQAHTVIWQTIVILVAIGLWVTWATRLPGHAEAAS